MLKSWWQEPVNRSSSSAPHLVALTLHGYGVLPTTPYLCFPNHVPGSV